MNRTPTVDTHSPWYEAFSRAQAAETTRWLSSAAIRPATSAPQAPSQPEGADDQWATEALFDYYNG